MGFTMPRGITRTVTQKRVSPGPQAECSSARFIGFKAQSSPEGALSLGFEASGRRFCMDCAHFKPGLSEPDTTFLHAMLVRYRYRAMVGEWVKKTRVAHGSKSRSDRTRTAKLLRERRFCLMELALVSPFDESCFAWKPRESASGASS
jgi:hypothetical protein